MKFSFVLTFVVLVLTSELARATQVNEIRINVPHEIDMGGPSRIAFVDMRCRLQAWLETLDKSERMIGARVRLDEQGKASGTTGFTFYRATSDKPVGYYDEYTQRYRFSITPELYSRFEADEAFVFYCYWHTVSNRKSKDFNNSEVTVGFVKPRYQYNAVYSTVSPTPESPEKSLIFPTYTGANQTVYVKMNDSSVPHFVKRFKLSDNEHSSAPDPEQKEPETKEPETKEPEDTWTDDQWPRTLPMRIEKDMTLTKGPKDIDYIVPKDQITEVKAALTIEPGVVVAFERNAGIGFHTGGELLALGTSEKKVKFKGRYDAKGFWRGIHLEGVGHIIQNAIISDAGSNYVFCCNNKSSVLIKQGELKLSNTSFSSNEGCDVYVGFRARIVESNNIYDQSNEGLCYQPKRISGDVETDTVWKNTPAKVDYVVAANTIIDVKAQLSIEPGVVIEFEEDAGMGVYDNGSLTIIGTQDNRITLKGTEDSPGHWRGIHTETNTTVEYTDIQNAGKNYVYCCNNVAALFAKSGSLSVTNSQIKSNKGCGIFVYKSRAALTESQNTYSANEQGNICE